MWAATVIGQRTCLPFGGWDGQWATWDVHLDLPNRKGELYRNGKRIMYGRISSELGALTAISWGANLNQNPPEPQTRYFKLLAVYLVRPPM